MPGRLVVGIVAGLGLTLAGCAESPPDDVAVNPAETAAAEPAAPIAYPGPVQIEMRNVHLHLGRGVVLKVRALRGEMRSTVRGQPPVFDNPGSYTLSVSEGEIAVDMNSLTNLMNNFVFAYEDAPIEKVTMSVDEGRLQQKGRLDKGIKIPFSVKAAVSATDDGRLKLEAESLRAAGIPMTNLMKLFGLSLDSIIDLKRRGLELDGNDVTIALGDVLPPPRLVGKLGRVEIAGGELRQTFVAPDRRPHPPLRPDSGAGNYVYFSGAVLKFGKLTMTGADLQLIDADEKDPFDFYPERYERQLIAGYSKNTADGGLHTFMPDFDDLSRTTGLRPKPRARR
jgi:hypothetical protein